MEENYQKFHGRYLRVWHEDVVLNPVGNTRKIYDFLNIKHEHSHGRVVAGSHFFTNQRLLVKEKSIINEKKFQ